MNVNVGIAGQVDVHVNGTTAEQTPASMRDAKGNLYAVSGLVLFDANAIGADLPALGVDRDAHLLAVPDHELHGAVTGAQAHLGLARNSVVSLPLIGRCRRD